MSKEDKGTTPGVFQILDDADKSAEDKFRENTGSALTETERQYGVIAVEVQPDDTDFIELTGATVTPTSGCYNHYSVPSGGGSIVLPAIDTKFNGKGHSLSIYFDTFDSATIGFDFPSGTSITVTGATPVVGKHYIAVCDYIKKRTSSAGVTPITYEWKWVVTIIEVAV